MWKQQHTANTAKPNTHTECVCVRWIFKKEEEEEEAEEKQKKNKNRAFMLYVICRQLGRLFGMELDFVFCLPRHTNIMYIFHIALIALKQG